eukprot:scaffold519_cov88-Cylindrotheca_fusiformis.AAC.1
MLLNFGAANSAHCRNLISSNARFLELDDSIVKTTNDIKELLFLVLDIRNYELPDDTGNESKEDLLAEAQAKEEKLEKQLGEARGKIEELTENHQSIIEGLSDTMMTENQLRRRH